MDFQPKISSPIKPVIPFLCFFLFMLCPVLGAAVLSDAEFFQCINFDYPGLGEVQSALTSGDTALAKAKLLEYYQNRTSVQYFKLSGSGSRSDASDNMNHYFTVNGVRLYAGQNDGTIDWTKKYSGDSEWHYQFHRMYWIVNYGKVYGSTHDEKWAKEWIAELVDWANDNAPGHPRTLDTGIRLRNWVESYQYFVPRYKSPSITPEDHVIVLKSLMEQCRFLCNHWRSDGNWGASETRGLGAVVVMFPEFKFTPDGDWNWWRDLVISRLQHHLSNDFYPDGVQYETSPTYHSLEYRNLFLNYELMTMNDISISDSLRTFFIRPLQFMMHIHKPDGYLPQLSDTDRHSYLDRLKDGAELFDRLDMLYVATRGKQGRPPATTFAAFPYGGYFVMRSDWGQSPKKYSDSKYLVFDTGSNKPWHAHYDILNFVAYANGQTLIRDAGRYTYVSGSWRDYFKGSAAHNTIVIDNCDQKQNAVGAPLYWASLPGADYVAGKHNAYSGLICERCIYFVKPDYWIISDLITGSGSHTYDLYFHLDSPFLNHTTLHQEDQSVTTPTFAIVPSQKSALAEVIDGWVSNKYNSRAKAPVVKYQKSGIPPITFETIILPYDSAAIPFKVEKQPVLIGEALVSPTDAFCLKILFNEHRDWFFQRRAVTNTISFATFRCDARAAFARVEPDAAVSHYDLFQGSLFYKGDTLLVETDARAANVSWYQKVLTIAGGSIQTVRAWAPGADSVIVDGKRKNFNQDGNYITIQETSVQTQQTAKGKPPATIQLEQNYPNPFNSHTRIFFHLVQPHHITVTIFNTYGQAIRTLFDGFACTGDHSLNWNGRNDFDHQVSSGVYFCRIVCTNGESATKKMLFFR